MMPCCCPRKEAPEVGPTHLMPVGVRRNGVCGDQHDQDNACGFPGRQHTGEERNREHP